MYAGIINHVVNRRELRQNYTLQLEDIQYGKSETQIKADFEINKNIISYYRKMIRKSGKRLHNIESLKEITGIIRGEYDWEEEQGNIPLFVNYGTNRLVLDIPLRIRKHHEFDVYSAYAKAIENQIDFRTFFEWYRNQEDYENECKISEGNLNYQDLALSSVRSAILSMLDECKNLRVARKPRLEMKVDKGNTSLNVSQLSDGEKCTMALFGDLARRLALANPKMTDPLQGGGVVLIDEIELHMHPFWQRKVLGVLRKTFPNIQFIITTHSPIVLSEADEDYNLIFMRIEDGTVKAFPRKRLDGYDANAILEQFMETKAQNQTTEKLIHSIYVDIQKKAYSDAEKKINNLFELTNENHPDVLMARMEIKRRKI